MWLGYFLVLKIIFIKEIFNLIFYKSELQKQGKPLPTIANSLVFDINRDPATAIVIMSKYRSELVLYFRYTPNEM